MSDLADLSSERVSPLPESVESLVVSDPADPASGLVGLVSASGDPEAAAVAPLSAVLVERSAVPELVEGRPLPK